MIKKEKINFPEYSGLRCLMMPYIQGEETSVPNEYRDLYSDIIRSVYFKKGDIGYLTIDESEAIKGVPHRGARAKYGRALHTEAGLIKGIYGWGGNPGWGGGFNVTLEKDVKILLANNIDSSCAIWNSEHENTSADGDIGDCAETYPYDTSVMMEANTVYEIGIFTPHESLPIKEDCKRQFLRIVSSGVHGREPYFTKNPLLTELGERKGE